MASRKGRCISLILWHKKGVFRFAKIARLTASAVQVASYQQIQAYTYQNRNDCTCPKKAPQ
jgi:hypothetical protein